MQGELRRGIWNQPGTPADEANRLFTEYKENRDMVHGLGSHYFITYPVQIRDSRRQSTIITRENGPSKEIEHCYYHGTVHGYPGAVAAMRTCNGISGVIQIGNETFIIHPFFGGDMSSKHPHLVYEAPSLTTQACANTRMYEWGLRNYRDLSDVPPPEWAGQAPRAPRDVRMVTKHIELALVLDKAMFDLRNASTRESVIHDAIQIVNIADQYYKTLNTRISLVYIETWSAENQATVSPAEEIQQALLNFKDYGSRKLFQISRDTTHLLTGARFKYRKTGMAVPRQICNDNSYGVTVDSNVYEPHVTASTMAHVLGHVIGMAHDDREGCTCSDWHGCIMSANIVGKDSVQPYKFSQCSRLDYHKELERSHGLCLFNRPNEVSLKIRNCGNGIVEDGEDCDCGTVDSAECARLDPCCDHITCKLRDQAECSSGPCCDNCKLRARGTLCRKAATECDVPEFCDGHKGTCPMDIHKKNGLVCAAGEGYCFNGICPARNQQCAQIWGYDSVSSDAQCYERFNTQGFVNGHCGKTAGNQFIKCEIGAPAGRVGAARRGDPGGPRAPPSAAPRRIRRSVQSTAGCRKLPDTGCQCHAPKTLPSPAAGETRPLCQLGYPNPVVASGGGAGDQTVSRTVISIRGQEFHCNVASGNMDPRRNPDHGMVLDGTRCGTDRICVNQTCTSIYPHISQGRCPGTGGKECSGHGVCTNMNTCFCHGGYAGPTCSQRSNQTVARPGDFTPHRMPSPQPEEDDSPLDGIDTRKRVTKMVKSSAAMKTLWLVVLLVTLVGCIFILFALVAMLKNDGSSTLHLVIMLVSLVGLIFLFFTFVALCYRRRSTTPKYGQHLGNKQGYPSLALPLNNRSSSSAEDLEASRMITFGSMPSYSSSFPREHKTQQPRQSPNPRGFPAGHAAAGGGAPNRLPGPSAQLGGAHPGAHPGAHGAHVGQHGGSLHGMPHAGPHAGPHGEAHGGPHGGSHRGSHAGLHAGAHGGSHASLPARGGLPLTGAGAAAMEPDDDDGFLDPRGSAVGKPPEKGILKKAVAGSGSLYGSVAGDRWAEESQSDTAEALSQSDNNHDSDTNGQVTEVERTLKSLNGYHEDILEALRNAASTRGTSSASYSDELRKSLTLSSNPELARAGASLLGSSEPDGSADALPRQATIRIRNLEDLIRQLEQPALRLRSPSSSDDVRLSETEADRQLRLESSSCTESQGRRSEFSAAGFVLGRYREPASGSPSDKLSGTSEGTSQPYTDDGTAVTGETER
ncbi:Disintegrin and metalloproteinase domain-containing protein 19 [Amphibalanus amphitrite]|uniref:Disintegrin and metalloproteinase domain-containing protein 19 n=1 Tax=Amphibalanus amphitrite TaxID=1232801 RepID=A0A6A4W072_AMPAM|nr:Disintegrin and metalloproteinase domain-containing protein 19 [Amphibalanus amphitrite]